MESTRRTCTLREIGIGLVALVASVALGVFAAGGLNAPNAVAAPEAAAVVESLTGLTCPDDATGFPTAVDPTCVTPTGEIVDAIG